jgi:hypothetical protein
MQRPTSSWLCTVTSGSKRDIYYLKLACYFVFPIPRLLRGGGFVPSICMKEDDSLLLNVALGVGCSVLVLIRINSTNRQNRNIINGNLLSIVFGSFGLDPQKIGTQVGNVILGLGPL